LEGLISRSYILAGGFALAGLAAHISLPAASHAKTEAWMEKTSVVQFGRYHMVQGSGDDPNVSYKMDSSAYATLAPYGIVARELTDGSNSFDVVLIASANKDSFHDPRVCFTAQGWQLDDQKVVPVTTQTRGVVPITLTNIQSDKGSRLAAFFYRGPYGFAATTNALKMQMFGYSLVNARNSDGVFYRFIAEEPDVTCEQFQGFIASYLDASGKQSGGYF
jgi:hypothetical protein